jgi:hypothetical protein
MLSTSTRYGSKPGPFGPIEAIEYVIIVSDLKGSHATPGDNLHAVALQLYEITKVTRQMNESINRLQPVEPSIPMEPETIKPSIGSSIPMEPLSGDDT